MKCSLRLSVLVPGAGLGRLAHDIAKLGYHAEGNEFSYFMLLMSDYIMNQCSPEKFGPDVIFPYIHQFSNVVTPEDQVRPVYFPDVEPGGLPESAGLSMVAGDFLEVYRPQVCTTRFIIAFF